VGDGLAWVRRGTAAVAAGVLFPLRAFAQEPAPSPSPSPEPSKIDVGSYVDTCYGYNLNKVDPPLRSYDVQHNTFSLSAAEVNFTKTLSTESRFGFRGDIWFGKAADLTAAYEPASDGKEVYKHLQQAYVSLLTGKVQWDAGKFVTPLGAEVIESQDDWNYTRCPGDAGLGAGGPLRVPGRHDGRIRQRLLHQVRWHQDERPVDAHDRTGVRLQRQDLSEE
jgi:hypothetical protein